MSGVHVPALPRRAGLGHPVDAPWAPRGTEVLLVLIFFPLSWWHRRSLWSSCKGFHICQGTSNAARNERWVRDFRFLYLKLVSASKVHRKQKQIFVRL